MTGGTPVALNTVQRTTGATYQVLLQHGSYWQRELLLLELTQAKLVVTLDATWSRRVDLDVADAAAVHHGDWCRLVDSVELMKCGCEGSDSTTQLEVQVAATTTVRDVDL